MKKVLMMALLVLISVSSYSQISWNVKAGVNMSNVGSNSDAKMKLGFNVGVGMEYQFSKMWSLQPSLMFTTKGTKSTLEEDGNKVKTTLNPMYLELPVLAAVRFAIADNQNIVVKAGPYFAYGVAGKLTIDLVDGGKAKTDVFGKGEDGESLHRFDCGIGVGIDYEISKFFVGLYGEYGLTNVYADFSDKNMNFSVGVGYKF